MTNTESEQGAVFSATFAALCASGGIRGPTSNTDYHDAETFDDLLNIYWSFSQYIAYFRPTLSTIFAGPTEPPWSLCCHVSCLWDCGVSTLPSMPSLCFGWVVVYMVWLCYGTEIAYLVGRAVDAAVQLSTQSSREWGGRGESCDLNGACNCTVMRQLFAVYIYV